jgi:hypothetical protein
MVVPHVEMNPAAPADTTFATSSPRRAKLADRMLGAMIVEVGACDGSVEYQTACRDATFWRT